MMKLEKKLASTDLNTYKATEFKEEPIKLLAKQIWEYQQYRNKSILSRINKYGFTDGTVVLYISRAMRYIHQGIKHKAGNDLFYSTLQECMDNKKHIVDPTNIKDARKFKTKTVEKRFSNSVVNKKLTEVFQYGVLFQDNVKVFDTEEECKAFALGYSYTGNNAKLVHITEV